MSNKIPDTSGTVFSGQVLDSLCEKTFSYQINYELAELLSACGLSYSMASFAVLAVDLSRVVGKSPAWTKKYIHSAYHGRIEVSPLLQRAISALGQQIDGTPAGVAGSVYVRVLAQPTLPEGVLIPAKAEAVKCARPGCPVVFVKINPLQRYHDVECRSKRK